MKKTAKEYVERTLDQTPVIDLREFNPGTEKDRYIIAHLVMRLRRMTRCALF